jgi:hypothetical protein
MLNRRLALVLNTWNTVLNYEASTLLQFYIWSHVTGTGISSQTWPFKEIVKCKEITQYDHAMPYKKTCNIW